MKTVLKICLILFVYSSMYADSEEVFTTKQSSIYKDESRTKPIGTVQTATPLKVIKEKNNFLLVELSGWSAEGSPEVVFHKIGQRIIYAVLDNEAIDLIKVIQTQLDDYDTKWHKITIPIWIKKESTTEDIKTIWSSASKLYLGRCSSCHAAPHFDDFTTNQWPGIIQSMKDRAGLMPDEFQLIVKYLQNSSK